jgi:phage terminase Nu1 subunit (DNA packaging protein)
MEMSNNKQLTAVQWYAGRQHDLEGLRDVGAISIVEYYEELTKAVQQAKEMEKERMKGMYVEGSFAKMRYYDGLEYIDAEQYYEQIYGGGEQ